MAIQFTTDFTQYVREVPHKTGSVYPLTWNSKSIHITEDYVHNGNALGDAWHYGIRATLRPHRVSGLIFQIVDTLVHTVYENGVSHTENNQYLEAWVTYSGKPLALDFLTDERNGQGWHGTPIYNRGIRTIKLVTWFVPNQNTRNLKELGFTTNLEVTNGLWGTTNVDAVRPPPDAIRRIVQFKWDYIDQSADHIETRLWSPE